METRQRPGFEYVFQKSRFRTAARCSGPSTSPSCPLLASHSLTCFASWIVSVTCSKNTMPPVSPFQSILSRVLTIRPVTGKSTNIYLGFQCFSADTITSFLFSTSFDQMSFPDFRGDLVEGIDIAMPTITFAKFSAFFVWLIHNAPNWLLKAASPRLNGVVLFREVGF